MRATYVYYKHFCVPLCDCLYKKTLTYIQLFVFVFETGKIEGVASNWDGSLLCTISDDKSLKVFEVVSFDLMNMLQFDYTPGHCEWVHTKGTEILNQWAVNSDSHV